MSKQLRPSNGDSSGTTLPSLSEETIKSIVANQTKELVLREQEIQLQREDQTHRRDLASKSIDAEKEDRAGTRAHEANMMRQRVIFAGVMFLLFVLTLLVLAFLGKDGLAEELIKMLTYGGLGLLGGYAYGSRAAGRNSNRSGDDSD